MKKLAFSLLLLGAASVAQAQTGAGTFLISGGVGYNSTKSEIAAGVAAPGAPKFEQKQQEFRFTPTVGYFVADNLAVGLTGRISGAKQESSQAYYNPNSGGNPIYFDITNKSSFKSIGPFVRYYKMVGEKAAFYGQLAGGYESGRSEGDSEAPIYSGSTTKIKTFYGNITPGFVFFPTDTFGLELTLGSLGYSNSETTEQGIGQNRNLKTEASSFGANFGLQSLNLAASFYLGGK